MLKIFVFLFVCMATGCGNFVSQNENTNQLQQNDKAELSLSMERTQCFGHCPVYKLKIKPNGKILFEGVRFTETIGKAESVIAEEKINQLIEEINKSGFFSLKDSYTSTLDNCPDTVTDSESVILKIKLNGKEKNYKSLFGLLGK